MDREQYSDVAGKCPRMPVELEEDNEEMWADGLRFESQYYDFEPSFFAPYHLSDDLRAARAAAIRDLFKATRSESIIWFHEAIVVVDRLLLESQAKLPEDMQMKVAVAACYVSRAISSGFGGSDFVGRVTESLDLAPETELVYQVARINQNLGYFADRKFLPAPRDWMWQYVSLMPDVVQRQVDKAGIEEIFFVIGAAGSLAHHRPSIVAAAVLTDIVDKQAEPFLCGCGFDMMDVANVLAEVREILDCRM